MNIKIIEQDHNNVQVRRDLIAYLQPHETQALFLLGNIQSRFGPAFIYVAEQEGNKVGVCGYYPTFKACTLFSESDIVSRLFAKEMLKRHGEVHTILGMANMAKPAYEEFLDHGREPLEDPEQVFLELEMSDFVPVSPVEGIVRPIKEEDVDRVAILTRLLRPVPSIDPVTEEERVKVKASDVIFCLEIDGKVVSVAASNGLAIQAFQILNVATDPAYQRRGYARAVCSHLIRYMQKRGAEKAVIFTGKDNMAAQKCYLSLGFQIVGHYYVGKFQDIRGFCEKRREEQCSQMNTLQL